MKKLAKVLLISLLVSSLAFSVHATTNDLKLHQADYSGMVKVEYSTYGLLCSILGHEEETSLQTVIVHKTRATSPRCDKNVYQITTCSRCGYMVETLVRSSKYVCCPAD